ncbi:hypothetical protein GCM10022409_41430 [Hymenobacter glaciei]|uniref:Uncharacterized protein n=1 Tax=Hymenobacter glaciei TaxID=877209 RepID=A0ABP7UT56_9BACT
MNNAARTITKVGFVVVVLLGLGGLALAFAKARQKSRENRQLTLRDSRLFPKESYRLMQFADTLAASQRDTLFRHHDLSQLLQICKEPGCAAQNGFFGLQPQRLEVAFTWVKQDAKQAGLFHVEGLTRVFGKVNLLKGSLQLTQARHAFDKPNGIYIATGPFRFQLYDDKSQPTGAMQGLAAVDFETYGNTVSLAGDEGAARMRSRQFAFEGTRTDAHATQTQRVVWASEFPPVGQEILGDFDIGGRVAIINPKYKKYGWDDYYNQDEWWFSSQTPLLANSYPNRVLP